MSTSRDKKYIVSKSTILSGLRNTGLKSGDVVLVHSAMRPIGWVEEGAASVVVALLEVVGPKGTVVAPAYTFIHQKAAEPIVDPASDRSEMGAISEAVRRHPEARRSVSFRHSLSAIGRRAREITEVDPRLCSFDPRGSFGVLVSLDAHILVLGVTYSSVTGSHVSELQWEVPYRRTFPKPGRVRLPGGELQSIVFTDYRPKPAEEGCDYDVRGPDYNRLGALLEKMGRVGIAAVGNAMARRFSFRDWCDTALAEMDKDSDFLRSTEPGKITPLRDGKIVLVDLTDASGTTDTYQWGVKDPSRLSLPAGVKSSIM